MNTNTAHIVEHLLCTAPMQVKGNGYSHPVLVRIELNRQSDDSVLLTSRGGHTGTHILNAKSVTISRTEWDNLRYDTLDEMVLANWAFSKAGWVLRDDE
ncbi:hypothetical protein QNL75_27025 [Pseudomonas amygdali pv. morsprunorum]|uniref:hypothetical protein n=1 Tax=Pseudomonas amygdali TaxID=47877 RepID=UPI00288D9CB9|nr:hypothetical protein [Pseudomonas amygdali]MDT3268712.1 hypothetical protein [Pseudomonas amygdali pv. morsprunorum]